jgi:glycosyltransferase involved in cell wall biosynthesis
VRAELKVNDELLVGMIARYEPVKGHEILLRAVKHLIGKAPRFRLVLVGRGCDYSNVALVQLIRELGISGIVTLLSERSDVPQLLNAFDVAVCPSLSESFPNAVGEAMSCELPCVVTDVGDCGYLVGDTGSVAPPSDPEALAFQIAVMLGMEQTTRVSLGRLARARIVKNFSMAAVLERYEAMYDAVGSNRPTYSAKKPARRSQSRDQPPCSEPDENR